MRSQASATERILFSKYLSVVNPPFTSAGPLGPQDRRTAVVSLPITIAGQRRPLRPQWPIYSSPLMGSSISMPYTPPHFPKAGFGLRAANMVFNKTELYNHKQPRLQLLACFVPSRNSPVHRSVPTSHTPFEVGSAGKTFLEGKNPAR